jgi:hypothetical protein
MGVRMILDFGLKTSLFSHSPHSPSLLKRCSTCGALLGGFPAKISATRQGEPQDRTFRSALPSLLRSKDAIENNPIFSIDNPYRNPAIVTVLEHFTNWSNAISIASPVPDARFALLSRFGVRNCQASILWIATMIIAPRAKIERIPTSTFIST